MFITRIALIALTLSATALFFPAAAVYLNNVHDYPVSLAELLLPSLLVVAMMSLVLTAAGILLPLRWRARALVLMTMASIGFWLQANILVWNYGYLDGGQIPWAQHHARGVLEVFVWLALLLVGWRQAHPLSARVTTIAGAVLGVQVLGLALAIWQAPAPPTHHRYSVDNSDQFSLSSEQNLVVIVLDAFQSDVFQQILDEQPHFHEVFDGFHYFRNALAGYAKTYPSIPLMLSGQWYENDESINRFMARAYLQGSLPQQLQQQGWDVRLYPHIMRTFHFDPALADNFIDQIDAAQRRAASAHFFDIGLFRALPHFIKPWWLNDYAWRLQALVPPADSGTSGQDENGSTAAPRSQHTHSAIRWLEDMQALSLRRDSAPAMRFYHLFVPHAPFLLNEALEMELLPADREGYYRHSIAALNLMAQYLQQLQAIQAYDNTTIAIVSEHGGGEYRAGVQSERLGLAPAENSALLPEIHASGLPLVLIKPPGARGTLQISDAPVSLADLAHTLATTSRAGPHQLPGKDMFSISATQARQRRFLFYQFDGFDVQYLPDMVEYQVDGHSWLAANWQASGRTLVSAGEARPQRRGARSSLQINERLHFAERGNGLRFLANGWSTPESTGSWSNAVSASIELPLAAAVEDDLLLQLSLRPFLSEIADPPLRSQQVNVLINAVPSAQWQVSEAGVFNVRVDADIHGGSRELLLELVLPDATRPAQLLQSEDVRQLGVELQQLSLDQSPGYRFGQRIDFSVDGNAEPYLDGGWSAAEDTHRWSDASLARLQIVLAQQVESDLQLHFTARAFTAAEQLPEQTVILQINGHTLASWQMAELQTQQLTVPAELFQDSRHLQIDWLLPDATRPLDLGTSTDTRQLGIALQELYFEAIE